MSLSNKILFLNYVCLCVTVCIWKSLVHVIIIFMCTATVDGSDDEEEADGYYRAKASTKKEKKRQEREAQRQVMISKGRFIIIMLGTFAPNSCKQRHLYL